MVLPSGSPRGLREKVLLQWLQGNSRDDIARNIGIGAGTASGIIKMYRQNDSNFDQQREYILHVKKRGLNIDQLGSAIRLSSRLDKLHLSDEELESLLDKIEEHCFRQGKDPEGFIKDVDEVCKLSSKTKVPVEQLSADIEQRKKELSRFDMDIIMKKVEWQKILRNHKISGMELEEFKKNRPLFQSLQTTRAALANVTKEKNDALRKLNQINDWLTVYSYPKDKKNDIKNANRRPVS